MKGGDIQTLPHHAPVNAERETFMSRYKPKKHFLSSEPEVFWYLNIKGEKLWGFRHRYYDSLSKRREKSKQGLRTENMAIRALLKLKTDLINGHLKKVENDNLTVFEWLDMWYEENKQNWAVTTRLDRKRIIDDKIKPLLGRYKLSQLDRSTYIREFINVLLEVHYISSVENYHDIFRTAVNAAVENEIIERNRFTKVTISKVEAKASSTVSNYLDPLQLKDTLQESEKLLDITQHTYILLLAYTGMRKGEACALKWKNIDFEEKKISIEATRDNYGLRSPKTKRSRRTIVISDILLAQIKKYRKWYIEKKFSIGEIISDEDFILINRMGHRVSANYINDAMKKLYAKSEVELKEITPHGLRHTHATILLTSEERIPVAVIAKRLGNTPQMINEVYGHVIEDIEVESVQSFDSAISP